MKRKIIGLSLAIIIATILIAIPVLAATFSVDIKVTNAATSAFVNTPFVATIDNAGMVSDGQLLASGLDARVMDGGTILPAMLTSNATWFVGGIAKNATKTFQYTTGNTPAVASMPIIVGDGGYITTPYDEDLEPVDNDFELDISGYINTSQGTDKYILDHAGEITIQVTGNKAITATVTDGAGDHAITLTGVTSGYYSIISLVNDSGALTFTVGTHTGVSGATIGTIPDNNSDWIWNENNTMSYIDSIQLSFKGSPYYLNHPSSVFVLGDYAYVTAYYNNALNIVNISDPTSPTFEGSISGDGSPNYLKHPVSVFVLGNYAYVAAVDDNSLTIIDVTNPALPTFEGHIAGAGSPNYLSGPASVFVLGNYAYVAAYSSNSLTIIDVTNPATPTFKGKISGAGNYLGTPQGVFVVGNYVYVAAGSSNSLTVIDVTNPASPTLKGHIAGAGSPNYLGGPNSVSVVGNYAYVAAGSSNSLTVIDVTNPASPTLKGHIAGAGSPNYLSGPYSVSVVGNYAYVVSSYDDSLTIIDVTNPAFPTLKGSIVGTVNYLGDPYSVFVLDDYAYVAAFDDNSLTIIDVTNPALPTFMGNILGGTEVLKYQPNTIISGTTLPDIDLTQDGIITFGVGAGTPPGNPPGVIVVPGPIKPISDARCNLCSASSQTFITTTPPEPSGMYDEGSTAGIPGANLVNDAIANAGIATDGLGVVHTEVFWYPLAFLIAIVLGFGAYGLTKEIIVQAAVSGIVMACFAGGGVLGTGLLPWFTVLIFAIEAVLFVIIKARQEV